MGDVQHDNSAQTDTAVCIVFVESSGANASQKAPQPWAAEVQPYIGTLRVPRHI
jgi:hypothetical protein